MTTVDLHDLIERYEVLLLDAYGVIVSSDGPLPGAVDMIRAIADAGRVFFVVTNDASRLPATHAARFARWGLPIAADRIITSGALIARHFADRGLGGARCMVLGPDDSATYVTDAGGVIVPVARDARCDAVVVCDEDGYPFLDTVDDVLTALFWHFDRGDPVDLVQPNPDLIYPKADGAFGFTSGGVTLMLEAALARRYPARQLAFARLGKPHRPIFDEARRLANTDSLVMIGDQLETDIAGARAAGIDAALIDTGVTRWSEREPIERQERSGAERREPQITDPALGPTYLLAPMR